MSLIINHVALLALVFTAFGIPPARADDLEKDRVFIVKAMKGDNSETALGKMAQQKGNSDGIRQYGITLAQDHKQAKSEAVEVARKLGLKPTEDIMPEARKEANKLTGLSGHDFDKEFADYMVKDHKQDIKDFQKQAEKGGHDTVELARKTLPVLEKHLQMAESLKKSL